VEDSDYKDSTSNSEVEATAYKGGGQPNAGANELEDASGNGRILPKGSESTIEYKLNSRLAREEVPAGANELESAF
jgi:hypothetical protein